ncbi:predicted protein [Botrytis cinerea T4]|uniref:Uncharacterized protein n=1 Tax=Botryotinia fuckeliana (strain T4) TaxID=999810 RepID=G2YIX1_BOTF4|nr:predicted protein [Botrytis cinerea T4]
MHNFQSANQTSAPPIQEFIPTPQHQTSNPHTYQHVFFLFRKPSIPTTIAQSNIKGVLRTMHKKDAILLFQTRAQRKISSSGTFRLTENEVEENTTQTQHQEIWYIF